MYFRKNEVINFTNLYYSLYMNHDIQYIMDNYFSCAEVPYFTSCSFQSLCCEGDALILKIHVDLQDGNLLWIEINANSTVIKFNSILNRRFDKQKVLENVTLLLRANGCLDIMTIVPFTYTRIQTSQNIGVHSKFSLDPLDDLTATKVATDLPTNVVLSHNYCMQNSKRYTILSNNGYSMNEQDSKINFSCRAIEEWKSCELDTMLLNADKTIIRLFVTYTNGNSIYVDITTGDSYVICRYDEKKMTVNEKQLAKDVCTLISDNYLFYNAEGKTILLNNAERRFNFDYMLDNNIKEKFIKIPYEKEEGDRLIIYSCRVRCFTRDMLIFQIIFSSGEFLKVTLDKSLPMRQAINYQYYKNFPEASFSDEEIQQILENFLCKNNLLVKVAVDTQSYFVKACDDKVLYGVIQSMSSSLGVSNLYKTIQEKKVANSTDTPKSSDDTLSVEDRGQVQDGGLLELPVLDKTIQEKKVANSTDTPKSSDDTLSVEDRGQAQGGGGFSVITNTVSDNTLPPSVMEKN